MRTPRPLMIHRFDHYSATTTAVAGEDVSTFTLANERVPCNWQEAGERVVRLYEQRNLRADASCFLLDEAVYDTVSVNDRLVFAGRNYQVVGKQDLCNLGKVFRVDVSEEN